MNIASSDVLSIIERNKEYSLLDYSIQYIIFVTLNIVFPNVIQEFSVVLEFEMKKYFRRKTLYFQERRGLIFRLYSMADIKTKRELNVQFIIFLQSLL